MQFIEHFKPYNLFSLVSELQGKQPNKFPWFLIGAYIVTISTAYLYYDNRFKILNSKIPNDSSGPPHI